MVVLYNGFFSHTKEGSQTQNVCVFQKKLTLFDILYQISPHQLLKYKCHVSLTVFPF